MCFKIKFRHYSIFVSVTYITKLYDQTILDTFQNVLVNNAHDCNMYILVIIKKHLMIFMYKIILLMYDQLHSYMMIYTTVLFIVYVCTCTFIQDNISIGLACNFHYICTRVTLMLGFLFSYTHGCTNTILTSDKKLK